MNHDEPRSPQNTTIDGTVQYQPQLEDKAACSTQATSDGTVEYQPQAETVSPETVGFELAAGIKAVETVHKMPDVPGYHLEKELGRGGMGVVYLARQLRLNRPVALKMILNAAHTDAQMKLRFIAEAEAIAKLHHSGIVQVYEFGTHDENPYFALEFLSGGSLDKALAGTPLPAMEAARLVAKLANAVQSAHEHGIVHRDLKPANILLNDETNLLSGQKSKDRSSTESSTLGTLQPKITDFGLVKQEGSDMTATGAILGTPSYMAPEQADGKKTVGPPADIYALGAILYECLTGRPPFKAAKMMETIFQVIHNDPVAPRQLVAAVPIDLETITLKCLQKSPEKRYATAADLEKDLHHFINGEPIDARPVSKLERAWRWCNRNRKLAAAIAAAVFIALLASVLGVKSVLDAKQMDVDAKQRAIDAQQRELDAQEKDKLTQVAKAERYGAQLLEAGQKEAMRPSGWTWNNLDQLKQAISIKPENANLAALRSSVVNAATALDVRRVKTLIPNFDADEMAFSPDGKTLAVGQARGSWIALTIKLIDTSTWKETASLSPKPIAVFREGRAASQDGIRSVVYSPDGKWLIAGARSGTMHRWDLTVKPPAYSSWQGHKGEVEIIVVSPDSRRAYSSGLDQLVKVWDIENNWKLVGQIEKLNSAHLLALSEDGTGVLTGVQNILTWFDAATLKPTTRLANLPVSGTTISMMRNGDTLLMERDHRIQMVGINGKPPNLFRLETTYARHPLISNRPGDDLKGTPDDRLFIVGTTSTDVLQIWDVRAGQLVNEFSIGGGQLKFTISPDSRFLAFGEENRVGLYELAGSRYADTVAVRPYSVMSIALNENGTELGCLSQVSHHGESFGLEITKWPIIDGNVRRKPQGSFLTERSYGPYLIRYAQDGSLIYLINDDFFGYHQGNAQVKWTGPSKDLKTFSMEPDGTIYSCEGSQLKKWTKPYNKGPVKLFDNVASGVLFGKKQLSTLATGKTVILIGTGDGTLRSYSPGSGKEEGIRSFVLKSGDGTPEEAMAIALSPDESTAIVGDRRGNVTFVEIPGLELRKSFIAHTSAITSLVAFQDKFFITGSNDRVVKIWDFQGQELYSFKMHAPVSQLILSPDGCKLYAAIGHDRAVTVWHLDRLNELLKSQGIGIDVMP